MYIYIYIIVSKFRQQTLKRILMTAAASSIIIIIHVTVALSSIIPAYTKMIIFNFSLDLSFSLSVENVVS